MTYGRTLMHDPAEGEDAHEQTGPLVRPYIAGEARHDAEGDRFWSEEHDEAALAAAQGQAQGEQADHGDVLAEDWRPETERPMPVVLESDDREPRGFLGSGWRSAPDPEDSEDAYGNEEDSRRGGMLLRAGLIGVGVVAAIWALALWVGSPAEPPCSAGAAGCAAGAPATSPTPAPDGASGDDAAVAEPGPGDDDLPSGAPTTAPTTAPTPGPTTTAPSRDTSARDQDAGPRATTSPRPARSRGPVRSQAPVPVDEPTEAPTTVAPTTEATTEPTTAPAPTQEAPRRGGGLLDILF
ncbi:hypothetical protein [Microbispora triticiradicis]|uniref:hypothetical protein n=1 Tax=Microbispora triticiradicis TaxID=2200763 RepID=UPI001AD6F6D2|nr:hypothetical protein [Microbispora triticiradicis]MBO4274610.1 hypothetical protein [Microbispora triticiradicis]